LRLPVSRFRRHYQQRACGPKVPPALCSPSQDQAGPNRKRRCYQRRFWCTNAWNRPTSTGTGGSDPRWLCWRGRPLSRSDGEATPHPGGVNWNLSPQSPFGLCRMGARDGRAHEARNLAADDRHHDPRGARRDRRLCHLEPLSARTIARSRGRRARGALLPCAFIHIGTKATPDISIWSAATTGQLTWSL
jgi:hypothetical protein